MISETALAGFLELETYIGGVWVPWLAKASSVEVNRGGKRNGATSTVDVGILTLVLVNAGDPLAGGQLTPNMPARLTLTTVTPALPIFTGNILDVDTAYALNKKTGKLSTYVTVTIVDAVAAHTNVTRYGAVTAGGAGYESWANRIIRLAASSTATINPPIDDNPIARYGI